MSDDEFDTDGEYDESIPLRSLYRQDILSPRSLTGALIYRPYYKVDEFGISFRFKSGDTQVAYQQALKNGIVSRSAPFGDMDHFLDFHPRKLDDRFVHIAIKVHEESLVFDGHTNVHMFKNINGGYNKMTLHLYNNHMNSYEANTHIFVVKQKKHIEWIEKPTYGSMNPDDMHRFQPLVRIPIVYRSMRYEQYEDDSDSAYSVYEDEDPIPPSLFVKSS
ncbi:MAG: hypothetical protein ACTSUE_09075 [Promethearchaeota archaeon]